MPTLRIAEAQLIAFALVDSNGAPVAGLGTAFVLQISKNGGGFAASTGAKAEIGSGWYSYTLSASETDTAGPLAVKVTGAGAVQANLAYDVSGSAWAVPSGTYILTATEASNVLRCAIDDPDMLALLPVVDAYIEQATGRDWAADTSIDPLAKAAARILLVLWHENPAQMASGQGMLPQGLTACLTQLEAKALSLATMGVPDEDLEIIASMPADGADDVAVGVTITVVFNHAMAAGVTSAAVLQTSAGASVATTNSLDVTGKLLTVNPDSDLSAASAYTLALTAAPDIYGQTISDTISFWTA